MEFNFSPLYYVYDGQTSSIPHGNYVIFPKNLPHPSLPQAIK